MATNGVNSVNYDGSCTFIRWNLSRIGGFISFELPKLTRKEEKIALLGESYPAVRTPGIYELGDATAELTVVGWKEMLAKLPDRYGDIEFPITTSESTPTVTGAYSTIMDRCRIKEVDPGKLENSEKGRIVKVTLSVILLHERGADGKFKTMGRRPGESPLASPAGQALMF